VRAAAAAARLAPRDGVDLLGLAALWGGSFLFLRLGAADFGPVALAAVRVAGAASFLLPLLLLRGQWATLRQHWRVIAVAGVTNSALPFLCFSYAALSIPAGLSSIFNAATPLFAAVIAWLWLRDRLTPLRALGLLIGFAGVVGLAWDKAGLSASTAAMPVSAPPGASPDLAILACLAGALMYGWSANFAKRHLAGVAPLAVAGGSQLSAALLLAAPAWWWWPAQSPSGTAWAAAAALAVLCTGVAYVIFFRLIARIGPAAAMNVTFLSPLFAVLWGALFLGEQPTWAMGLGCAVIVFGTALGLGLLRWPQGAAGPGRPAAEDH
jgi:drug/metabolite transporter (DMT)-like permease